MQGQPGVYLTGFMGTGKTAVGQQLARQLRRAFLDLDELIETEAGRSIPEIFESEGEAGFRKLEQRCLRQAAALQAAVVAVGGGAVIDPENRRLMRETGVVIRLKAEPAEILRRLAASETVRPLLAADNPAQRVASLLAEREKVYRDADMEVETDRREPGEVADEIRRRLPFPADQPQRRGEPAAERLTVEVAGASYPVFLAPSALPRAEIYFSGFPDARRAAIVTNPLVKSMYGAGLRDSLRRAGLECTFVPVPDGERAKTLEWAARIYDVLAEEGFSRSDPLVALGGGVVGDLGGFVAATFMRGMPLVQVPTTLLAQVDAGIGGKTAINHPRAKNLVGCFYQPRLCLMDLGALRTLPHKVYAEGFAEMVKYALLEGEGFLRRLEEDKDALLSRDLCALSRVVGRCLAIKARYVRADEKDTGARMALNLGHTLAHALENVLGYAGLRHGEAVALGLIWCARLAAKTGLASEQTARRVSSLLDSFGLPIRLPEDVDPAALLGPMGLDKKARGGKLRVVLPAGEGETVVREAPCLPDLLESLAVLRDST